MRNTAAEYVGTCGMNDDFSDSGVDGKIVLSRFEPSVLNNRSEHDDFLEFQSQSLPMQETRVRSVSIQSALGGKKSAKTLALITTALLSASPMVFAAASPEPMPPPPELTNSVEMRMRSDQVGAHYQDRNFSRPEEAPYDPYSTPASAYLPPLPNTQAAAYADSLTGRESSQAGVSVANQYGTTGYAQEGFTVSPPAHLMPEDYFNLPLVEAGIPGVVLPEFNEEFYDPGMYDARTGKRILQQGMSTRQLEPFFELAKGSEKHALEARKQNDEYSYRQELLKAIDGYMEIIAMADASNEAREEAWYGVARCEYRRENWWKAFDALERSFPHAFDKAEVEGRVKLEMFIGERLWRIGNTPVPGASQDGEALSGYQAASRVYAAAVFNHPGNKDAPLALLRRGDAAAMDQNWQEAAKFYRTVVQNYPESEAAMQARSSLAEAVYRQEWPAGMPEAARVDMATIMDNVEKTERKLSIPAEERRQRAVVLANDQEAGEKLRQAKAYLTKMRVKKSKDAAIFLLGDIVSHYPNTEQADEAAGLLRGMGIEPPMVLSEGTRFPLAPPSEPGAVRGVPGPGGSVQLERSGERDSSGRSGLNYSPAPELHYVPSTRPPDLGNPTTRTADGY